MFLPVSVIQKRGGRHRQQRQGNQPDPLDFLLLVLLPVLAPLSFFFSGLAFLSDCATFFFLPVLKSVSYLCQGILAAIGTLAERLVADLLQGFELVPAGSTLVLVNRHDINLISHFFKQNWRIIQTRGNKLIAVNSRKTST
jgi:hypothetical protein